MLDANTFPISGGVVDVAAGYGRRDLQSSALRNPTGDAIEAPGRGSVVKNVCSEFDTYMLGSMPIGLEWDDGVVGWDVEPGDSNNRPMSLLGEQATRTCVNPGEDIHTPELDGWRDSFRAVTNPC
jgi:hypothetical protein